MKKFKVYYLYRYQLFKKQDGIIKIYHSILELIGHTPIVKSGLLAGTYREFLLKQGKISEKTLKLADLNTCTKIWLINSVRKWVEVERIESK
ncbi:aminotransferase class IV [Caldifermentibacillus hisashii]|uniref:aminotransferase class IV n=1 Tax=Caldifermentibacillus hisashii TaxID=996558 RepID=UPI0022B94800|nr:aminotransferase class IV [Caldifermentibacillus hisashii]